jgi:DNA-binding transcriptional LysR family regulator
MHQRTGSVYFERCKVILEELEEAELAVGSVSGVPRGTLRVTAPSWFATRGMVDLIAAYWQLYPEVVADISFEDRFVDLIEEGYDLAESPLLTRPLRTGGGRLAGPSIRLWNIAARSSKRPAPLTSAKALLPITLRKN